MEARCTGVCGVGRELEVERFESGNQFPKQMLNRVEGRGTGKAYGVTIIGGRAPSGVRRS